MQKLTISITNYPELPGSQIIYFDGDFDGYAKDNVAELQKVVDKCPQKAVLIFDFSRLNYLNSYAIGQLVSWHNQLSTLNGKIYIVGPNKNVEDIFSVLGINSIFKTYSSLDDLKKDLA